MFDVIPYWMWAVSLLVLALVCGAALSAHEPQHSVLRARQPQPRGQRGKWRLR
ncbi:MAG: hypothetical protein RXR20_30375 [Paraburkholderia sp.]|jgi:hypothetical protein|uniref:hypothetical protein n=1 Tax=Burkholderiaceae TaxID=119060 RepID=UPI00148535F2|nr:hypothetical protein [Burkholderia sp. 4M9327F10]